MEMDGGVEANVAWEEEAGVRIREEESTHHAHGDEIS